MARYLFRISAMDLCFAFSSYLTNLIVNLNVLNYEN